MNVKVRALTGGLQALELRVGREHGHVGAKVRANLDRGLSRHRRAKALHAQQGQHESGSACNQRRMASSQPKRETRTVPVMVIQLTVGLVGQSPVLTALTGSGQPVTPVMVGAA